MFGRYLNPKNDLAFKKIFGSAQHKDIPIDFLNAVFNLEGPERIIDLKFLNPRQPAKIASRKESIVDVLVKDQNGARYVIEMQVANKPGFEKRAQYYAAKTYLEHCNAGDKYGKLTKVIFLAITDYIAFPKKKERYKSDHVLLDKKSYEQDLKDFHFTFVELPKFNKKLNEIETIEDKWYYFLKHSNDASVEEILKQHPQIAEAYGILERHHWTEDELRWYSGFEKKGMDDRTFADWIQNAGKRAREKGLKEGREEGRLEGRAEGKREGMIDIIQRLLKNGQPPEVVAEVSNFDLAQIYQIMNSDESQSS